MGKGPPKAQVLGDDEIVTQFGRDDEFRNSPRLDRENDVSLIRGQVTATRAAKIVGIRNPVEGTEVVRHAAVGTLRARGFVVNHTSRVRNRKHVSVTFEGDWSNEVCEALDSAFTEEG